MLLENEKRCILTQTMVAKETKTHRKGRMFLSKLLLGLIFYLSFGSEQVAKDIR